MENNKNQQAKFAQLKSRVSHAPTGRPNLDEINKRNAAEERRDRRSSYAIAGIMALVVLVVMFLVYFFT